MVDEFGKLQRHQARKAAAVLRRESKLRSGWNAYSGKIKEYIVNVTPVLFLTFLFPIKWSFLSSNLCTPIRDDYKN